MTNTIPRRSKYVRWKRDVGLRELIVPAMIYLLLFR